MLPTVTHPITHPITHVAHTLGGLIRHADAALTRGAALNAAVAVAADQARVLADARTMVDLRRLELLAQARPDADGDVTSGR